MGSKQHTPSPTRVPSYVLSILCKCLSHLHLSYLNYCHGQHASPDTSENWEAR